MITLTVSGKTKQCDDGITVAKLIELEDVETPKYVSVSVNEDFIKSSDYPTHILKDGDNIEFIYFMGGGR